MLLFTRPLEVHVGINSIGKSSGPNEAFGIFDWLLSAFIPKVVDEVDNYEFTSDGVRIKRANDE